MDRVGLGFDLRNIKLAITFTFLTETVCRQLDVSLEFGDMDKRYNTAFKIRQCRGYLNPWKWP